MRSIVWDLLILAGVALVSVGLGLIYLPLAVLFVGVSLLGVGLWGSLTVAREAALERIRKLRDRK